jgi:hypothetical protein
MTNDALLWNAPPPPPRRARRAEHVSSMRKCGKQVDAELRGMRRVGWECQFLHNGELAYGRRWVTRANALAEAEEKRRELSSKGWQSGPDDVPQAGSGERHVDF